jgi:hypothetical protein
MWKRRTEWSVGTGYPVDLALQCQCAREIGWWSGASDEQRQPPRTGQDGTTRSFRHPSVIHLSLCVPIHLFYFTPCGPCQRRWFRSTQACASPQLLGPGSLGVGQEEVKFPYLYYSSVIIAFRTTGPRPPFMSTSLFDNGHDIHMLFTQLDLTV